jgi:hypothetical protein
MQTGSPAPVILQRRVPCGVNTARVVDVVKVGGGEGVARRLAEFLAGVRRKMIDIRRYRVGRTWTRLSAGKSKRRAAALVARTGTGSGGSEQARKRQRTATAGDRMTVR